MTQQEYDKIVHLMNHVALQGIDTGRLDKRCRDVIPLEDAIAIVDEVYKDSADDCISKKAFIQRAQAALDTFEDCSEDFKLGASSIIMLLRVERPV